MKGIDKEKHIVLVVHFNSNTFSALCWLELNYQKTESLQIFPNCGVCFVIYTLSNYI